MPYLGCTFLHHPILQGIHYKCALVKSSRTTMELAQDCCSEHSISLSELCDIDDLYPALPKHAPLPAEHQHKLCMVAFLPSMVPRALGLPRSQREPKYPSPMWAYYNGLASDLFSYECSQCSAWCAYRYFPFWQIWYAQLKRDWSMRNNFRYSSFLRRMSRIRLPFKWVNI